MIVGYVHDLNFLSTDGQRLQLNLLRVSQSTRIYASPDSTCLLQWSIITYPSIFECRLRWINPNLLLSFSAVFCGAVLCRKKKSGKTRRCYTFSSVSILMQSCIAINRMRGKHVTQGIAFLYSHTRLFILIILTPSSQCLRVQLNKAGLPEEAGEVVAVAAVLLEQARLKLLDVGPRWLVEAASPLGFLQVLLHTVSFF